MLDTDTKRRIDNCRDILVGKVPDPKSQVEQITIALIYKFMDDMDAEAEELGGKRKFFAGSYGKYGWSKLMAPNMGGIDILMLYSEAIQKMNENPGIPALFRDIFKNAYLPYRDPETLRSFLKEINTFSYDHSEKLGDAFEYLLSVLGSQGDAGQFRTPRHIIEFIVDIIDPKKNETILDPACGTAGFLISAYKHILDANKKERPGDKLTPDERKRLAANIHGYDISPDMVRLSLVNLYLHGFANPRIEEYDTLTSEEKWNEYADIILANPPFMSPKGGIKPHKRFSVQASRSEVLFVDYIAEHLTPTGRAGIIVPEGIIFQSGTAYKQLREMLVKNSLVAVVSLPAGVFNPYSGVKTSILVLDKSLSKQSDTILFIKIESEGTDLAARRRTTETSDLPQAKSELAEYMQTLRSKNPTTTLQFKLGLIVAKESIAENGEYNLSRERYQEDIVNLSKFISVDIGEIFEQSGKEKAGSRLLPIMSITMKDGLIDQSQKFKKRIASEDISSYKVVLKDELVVGFPIDEGVLGFLTQYEAAAVSPAYGIWRIRSEKRAFVDVDFLEMLLRSSRAVQVYKSKMQGAVSRRRSVPAGIFVKIQIPLPPLEIQKEIVAEIEGYQKVIDGAHSVIENYRPHIPIHPDWSMVTLSEICEFRSGLWKGEEEPLRVVKILRNTNFTKTGYLNLENVAEHPVEVKQLQSRLLQYGDIILEKSGGGPLQPVGRVVMFNIKNGEYSYSNFTARIRILDKRANPFFVWVILNHFYQIGKTEGLQNQTSGIRNLDNQAYQALKIPLPPLSTQQAIVAEIEAEQTLVAANRELIARFEKKIQTTIGRIWGEEGI